MTDASTIRPELVHCGVDWITVTAMGGKVSQSLFEDGQLLMREAVSSGDDKKPWSMSGFHGYKAGQCQCGVRGEEVIVRLSGDMAHDHWRELYRDADRCTRIDVQATYRLGCKVEPVITRHFEQAKRQTANMKRGPTLSKLSTNNGPSTVYFNKRCSEAFARIYDKGGESGLDQLKNCIRYEVEYKGNEASRVSAYLESQSQPDVAAALLALGFFERRGVSLGKAAIYSDPP